MVFLEIWIRVGEVKYGCLERMRFNNEEILYTNDIHVYNSKKYSYQCRVSLKYDKRKSTWTFTQRLTPFQNSSVVIYWNKQKYFKEDCHFETSGQPLIDYLTHNHLKYYCS